MRSVSHYQAEAKRYGEHVYNMITKIMAEHAYRNIRKVQAIFRLAEKYGHEAVNLTCKRCLYYEDIKMATIKGILEKNLFHAPLEEEPVGTARMDSLFTRSPEYFKHTMEEIE